MVRMEENRGKWWRGRGNGGKVEKMVGMEGKWWEGKEKVVRRRVEVLRSDEM